MLGKMIKHEFIATGRSFLPMYIFMIILTPVFSLITRLSHENSKDFGIINILGGLSIFGFIVMMIGIFMASFILIVVRFYQTTATSEAYLTFTLPVSTHHIILSKLLAAIVWQLLSGVLMLACILVMSFITGILSPADFVDGLQHYLPLISDELPKSYWFLFPTMLAVGAISGTLQYYCSIMLGQLFRDHRIIGSIGVYLALSTITQIISSVAVFPIMFFIADAEGNISNSYDIIIFTIGILLSLVFGVVYYFATSYVMKRRLNVQ